MKQRILFEITHSALLHPLHVVIYLHSFTYFYLSPFTLSKLDQGKDKVDFVQVCMQKSHSAALGSCK